MQKTIQLTLENHATHTGTIICITYGFNLNSGNFEYKIIVFIDKVMTLNLIILRRHCVVRLEYQAEVTGSCKTNLT